MFKQFLNFIITFFQREKREYLIIPKDTVFTGELNGKEVYIDGQLKTKNLNIYYLEVGDNGWIDGNICAEKVYISGRVTGKITCDTLVLHKGAKVTGNIYCNNITIQTGAQYSGNIEYYTCAIEKDSYLHGSLKFVEVVTTSE